MSKAHDNQFACPIIEKHRRRELAEVAFAADVVSAFKTYEERSKLVDAVGDEINKVPSDYIPFGVFVFKGFTFIYASIWSESHDMFFMEIKLASKMLQVGTAFAYHDFEFNEEEDVISH